MDSQTFIKSEPQQINRFKEQAEKYGLQIRFENTKYVTNIQTVRKHQQTEYVRNERTDGFEYVGEIVQKLWG